MALLALWSLGGCSKVIRDSSSVHISISSDISDLDDKVLVQVALVGPGNPTPPKDLQFTLSEARVGFVLLPHSLGTEVFRVKAMGLQQDSVVVSQTITSNFLPGKLANLSILLSKKCKGTLCDDLPSQTCIDGACKPWPVVPATAGTVAPTDGGTDTLVDGDLSAEKPDIATEASDSSSDDRCRQKGQVGNGLACSCDLECGSEHCVDGICCDGACTDVCHSCALPSFAGICTLVAGGDKPQHPGECPITEISTCGLDGRCDGAGACRKYPEQTICGTGRCDQAETSVVDTKRCVQGICQTAAPKPCAPFKCDVTQNACVETCTAENQCVAGMSCKDGSCGKKLEGACLKNSDCASDHCADGVCCDAPCTGACQACNLPATSGKCTAVAERQADPHSLCKDQGKSSCGITGLCDKAGQCARYVQGTMCNPPVCAGSGAAIPAATCDGAGACIAGTPIACAPYQCTNATGSCLSLCGSDNDCTSPNKCVAGTCGLKGVGQSCSGNGECKAGLLCVDDVCCTSACAGACQACNLAGHLGTCTDSPPTNDVQNCGTCGHVCAGPTSGVGTPVCTAGQCDVTCLNGTKCGSSCVITATDTTNCGACGVKCSTQNVPSPQCAAGRCTGDCLKGFGDCNGNKASDGCEAELSSNHDNCGTCGFRCELWESCVAGACQRPLPRVVAFRDRTCVIKADGSTSCANATATFSLATYQSADPISAENVADVKFCDGGVCVLHKNGSIECSGCLDTEPLPFLNKDFFVTSDVGCGIQLDGALKCSALSYIAPRFIANVPQGLNYRQVTGCYACGPSQERVFALDANGSVATWGENPPKVASTKTFKDISNWPVGVTSTGDVWRYDGDVSTGAPAGTYKAAATCNTANYTCAITEAGALVCWGSAGYPLPSGATGPYRQISAGWSHVCAVSEAGKAVCWGDPAEQPLTTIFN